MAALEQQIAELESKLERLYDEREKIVVALDTCHQQQITVRYTEEQDGTYLVMLQQGQMESACRGQRLSRALFGALTALGK